MAFRGNNNRNRNFGGNYGGGPMAGGNNRMGMNMSPWDNQNAGGGNYGGGNMRQGGGGGGVGGGQGMNAQAISLANNLLNNLFRNQNPPSLLDLPRGGGMAGNRNQRPGPMVNRAGPGNRNNQRRVQGGFNNRGGAKVAANKQGGGIRKQNAFDRAKKLLAKNSNKKKDSAPGENTENPKKNESQVKESPYANVPNDMFYCHLCKKHMWDANSFENHIKGRAHLMMREGIEESYRLRANMIRQEAKIAEQLKSVELDRLKRMGKSKNRNLEYCTMCDLNFHGHLSAHRKSDGHLQLKKFLHPKCTECNKEFSTRIDYDSHLLSADHLKKAAEKNTKVGERKKNTLTILTEEDELKDVRPPQKKKKKAAAPAAGEVKKEGEEGDEKKEGEEGDEKKEGEEEAADETKEGDELNETKEEEEEEVALPEDAEDIIIDFNDGDDVPVEIDAKLPKYNWTRPVGASMITKLECFECSICGKFFDTEKTVEVHSRTVSHHRQFVKFLNDKSSDTKIAQKRAAAAIEETERKKRKIEEATAAAAAVEAKKEAGEEEGADAEVKEENGEEANDELYDPSEATGDDEDVDMAENGDKEVADEEMVDEENGDAAADEEEMETQIEEKDEATPVKAAEPAKAAPATPAATPAPAAAATPTTPTQATSPQKKGAAAAAAKTPAAKATPRGRGRGRYNRY